MNVVSVTDEQRQRWDMNRVRKKRTQKIMWIAMMAGLLGILTVLISLYVHILAIAAGRTKDIIVILFELICCVLLLLGIYRKSTLILIAAAVLWVACCILSGGIYLELVPVSAGISLYGVYEWKKLESEEGFPDFDIDRLEKTLSDQNEQKIRANMAAAMHSPASGSGKMDQI